MSFYHNDRVYDGAQIVFYEVYRHHKENDRGGTYDSYYLVSTADNIDEATFMCEQLQAAADIVAEKAKGYKAVWEEVPCATSSSGTARRSTGRWTDEFGYIAALNKFRQVDKEFFAAGDPKYKFRAVRRIGRVDLSKL